MALFLTGDDLSITDQFLVVPINGIDWARDQLYAALALLTDPNNWEELGAATVDDAAQVFSAAIEDAYLLPDPIGMIFPTANPGTDFAPHALLCDGTLYNTVDYPSLFGVIGYTFGGSGAHFQVPNLAARFPVGLGTIHGTPYGMGAQGGEQSHTLTVGEMPSHTHTDTGHQHTETGAAATIINGGLEAPASSAVPVASVTGTASANLTNTGGGGAHENMPPWLALGYWIVTGL